MLKKIELAPCGVFCKACPSFSKTCFGCASEDQNQSRSSKWSCKIRNCCYSLKEQNYCIECEEFPCNMMNKKLINSHLDDSKFTYRHEIPVIFHALKSLSVKNYLRFQNQRWKCKFCGGIILFYHYKCANCGKEQMVIYT